ncbi:uncharacterized protein V1510DRAFT_404752 [Dipodascopsis tothii]|uniref:uncharacterized protein n=1 Tax=Dipodascopsis tothii TaxID=44089 RepID=UPI0034CDB0A5
MSAIDSYRLASSARLKLSRAVSKHDYDLRRVLSHSAVLDSVMEHLARPQYAATAPASKEDKTEPDAPRVACAVTEVGEDDDDDLDDLYYTDLPAYGSMVVSHELVYDDDADGSASDSDAYSESDSDSDSDADDGDLPINQLRSLEPGQPGFAGAEVDESFPVLTRVPTRRPMHALPIYEDDEEDVPRLVHTISSSDDSDSETDGVLAASFGSLMASRTLPRRR